MNDERIRQGATFEITLTDTDITAETAKMTVSDADGIVAEVTESFATVDDKHAVTLKLDTTDIPLSSEEVEYEYMYTITYSDGTVVKLPDADGCEDETCELPKFIVCEANDIETS